MELGDGKLANSDGLHADIIMLPSEFISGGSLITEIFGDSITPRQVQCNPNRAILCPKNEDTFKINDEVLGRLEGNPMEYLSIDSIDSLDPQEQANFPTEYLNSVTLGCQFIVLS